VKLFPIEQPPSRTLKRAVTFAFSITTKPGRCPPGLAVISGGVRDEVHAFSSAAIKTGSDCYAFGIPVPRRPETSPTRELK